MTSLSLVKPAPGFVGAGGPTGSDLVGIPQDESYVLSLIQAEVETPIPLRVEGELFDRATGTVELTGQVARKATQTCLYEITQAPDRFYDRILTIEQIMSRIRHFAGMAIEASEQAYATPECKKSCILAALGRCPLAMAELDITQESFAELVGIQFKSKRRPKKLQPPGVVAFRFFSGRSFSVSAPGTRLSTDEEIMENSAINHVVGWWVKYGPKKQPIVRAEITTQPKQIGMEFPD